MELVVAQVEGTDILLQRDDNERKAVLMCLWGSKSNETFFSFPSSARMVQVKRTIPLGGPAIIQLQPLLGTGVGFPAQNAC